MIQQARYVLAIPLLPMEEEVLRLHQDGESNAEIHRRTGRTMAYIRDVLERNGVPRRARGRPRSVQAASEILALYRAGQSKAEIRRRTDYSADTIRSVIERAGGPRQPRGRSPRAIGTEHITTDGNGKLRCMVKVAMPNVWQPRAVLMWEQHNGVLPAGMKVHHMDGDTLNDSPDNLIAMPQGVHMRVHHAERRGEIEQAAWLAEALAEQQAMDKTEGDTATQ